MNYTNTYPSKSSMTRLDKTYKIYQPIYHIFFNSWQIFFSDLGFSCYTMVVFNVPSDLNTIFQAGTQIGMGPATLQDIVNHLEATYCQSIGLEFYYMREPERIDWFKERIELKNRPIYSNDEKKWIFSKLNSATEFEQFLAKKVHHILTIRTFMCHI